MRHHNGTHRLPAVTDRGYVHWFPVEASERATDGWAFVLGGALCGSFPDGRYRKGTLGWWGSKRRMMCKRCARAALKCPLPVVPEPAPPVPASGDAPTLGAQRA